MQKIAQVFSTTSIQRIQKTYGVSKKCATTIFSAEGKKATSDTSGMGSVLQLLMEWNLNLEEVRNFPQVLKRPPMALDHHKHILEECGIPVAVSSLAFYLQLNRCFMFALKAHNLMPAGHDVIQSLCRSVDMSADDIRGGLGAVGSRSLMDVRLTVFRRYLCQRLGCDEQTAQIMETRYPRNRHKSLRLTARLLDVLERHFSSEKIVRNPYLLNTHPDQLDALLSNCPTVASVDISQLMQRVPRIAYMPWHNTVQVVQCLIEHGFSQKAIANNVGLLTLSAETVRWRIVQMSEMPELWAMRHNPNFLKMVYAFRRTMSRLGYLKSANMRCLSVHILSTFYPYFRRYISTGEEKSGGCDMVTFVSRRLDMPARRVFQQLSLHPFWRLVPLPAVAETIEALIEAGFSVGQCRHALQLLLYPQQRVLAAAAATAAAAAAAAERTDVPEEYLLQLVLYSIESDSHFSGTGVFQFTAERPQVAGES